MDIYCKKRKKRNKLSTLECNKWDVLLLNPNTRPPPSPPEHDHDWNQLRRYDLASLGSHYCDSYAGCIAPM